MGFWHQASQENVSGGGAGSWVREKAKDGLKVGLRGMFYHGKVPALCVFLGYDSYFESRGRGR